jgi:hypothetical protein
MIAHFDGGSGGGGGGEDRARVIMQRLQRLCCASLMFQEHPDYTHGCDLLNALEEWDCGLAPAMARDLFAMLPSVTQRAVMRRKGGRSHEPHHSH